MSEKFGVFWFMFCALLAVAWLGVCIWVLIKVVTWLTHQSF